MHGATTLNLASMLDRHARLIPDRVAVVCQEVRLTYGQLHALAGQVASGLRARGIGPGDHVALSCPNILHFPVVYFGILRAGAAVVPLNVLFKAPEIAYHLKDSDAVAYFCFEGTPELPMAAMGKEGFDQVDTCRHFIVMPRELTGMTSIDGAISFAQFIAGQPAECTIAPTRADDPAVLLYTSGTTGQPKGAELSHANILFNGIVCAELMLATVRLAPDVPAVVLVTLPLFHSFGQVAQMVKSIYKGLTLVLLPRFEPRAVIETMRAEHVNAWAGVPTMYWALLQCVSANTLDVADIATHLMSCTSGGAPMPVEVMKRFESTFGVRVLEGYGLSETSPVATFNHSERPTRPGTVGQPVFGVEVACVNEHDEPAPVGERGEIVIRGHNIMKGYYKRPDATAEAIRNGWFHTGDIGIIDADGYLSIVDRKKDMIIRGGFNVYPRELEETLMTHPAVSLCAVIGVADDRLGEEVKAFIVRKPGAAATEAEVVSWCRERMAAYKAPRYVEFREQLPMGATGKVLKRELRGAP
jgi:long-chain acyl-CoA synthetase